MSETNKQRSTRTQASIIQATVRLLKEKTLENTTIRDICSEAGVSIGAFYHHFSSRQELINHAFLLFDDTLGDKLPNTDDPPPLAAMKEVLMVQTRFIVEKAGKLITEYYKNILTDSSHSAVNPQRKYYRTVLRHAARAADAGLLKEGFGPEYVTELLIKFVRGCIVDWCLHDCSYDIVQLTSRELDLILGAISVPR